MSKDTFYLTTTLPYVNAEPHIGFALEIVHADIVARHKKIEGHEVFFNTGTDEHGIKIYRKAQEEGKDPQAYVDEYAEKFKNLKNILGLSEDVHFIRTTDQKHKEAAQEFWKRCDKNGYIYKKNYKVKYCVGCELEKTDSELENGCCPIHPNLGIEHIEEENYFFKFSEFGEKLMDHYNAHPDFVIPDFRLNEIKKLIEGGLEDFSISRLKEKMPWGVEVPGDDTQVMYVWFDALVNYISTIGWPDESYVKWWPVVQFAGKDNLRQQCAMWQAMLMAAGVEPSKQVVIHGFITSAGAKMSKSLGNVVNPVEIAEEYGTDALRYYLARHVHPFEDSDYTPEKFKEAYNANLANGLGNLTARIMKMSSEYLDDPVDLSDVKKKNDVKEFFDGYKLNYAMDFLWAQMGVLDETIQQQKPFEVIKESKERAQKLVAHLVKELSRIVKDLEPFMPDTAEKIQTAVKENKMPQTLFPRKE